LEKAIPALADCLARKIIRRRKSAGLTQTDLARRAGIRPETLSRLEKGESTPDVETVDKIIRVLERVDAKASP
jgi:transcriptional regulator with XRE-family HTH domain